MSLADSTQAIGAVTALLQNQLSANHLVTVGRPEEAAKNNTHPKINLFLYQIDIDASLRNVSLEEGRSAPLWFCLKYLVTAFDKDNSSDSADAHELLGQGMSTLHALNFLGTGTSLALEHSPEPLKITFDEAPADLLSKIMQGTDEKYRLSAAFQVRPVMIAPADIPDYSLLVGVDYTEVPAKIIGEAGIGLDVLASLGPVIDGVDPERFEPGQIFEIHGSNLDLGGLECWLGGTQLAVVAQRPDRLSVRAEGEIPGGAVEGPIAAGGTVSAGEHPLMLRQRLPNGRFRTSNMRVVSLLPVVSHVTIGVDGLSVTGVLLGRAKDDIVVALYRDGKVAQLPFDDVSVTANQKSLVVSSATSGTAPGEYQVIVRINGQQARRSPRAVFS